MKPLRGVLKDVTLYTITGVLYGTLVSDDACEGEEDRRTITKGRCIQTSKIVSIVHGEDGTIAETRNSRYEILGDFKTV